MIFCTKVKFYVKKIMLVVKNNNMNTAFINKKMQKYNLLHQKTYYYYIYQKQKP